MKTKDCPLEIRKRSLEKVLDISKRLEGDLLVKVGFDEETAVREAWRCFEESQCESCDLCRLFCPDLCITWNENKGQIEIDYDYCKGCGICVAICPKGAIKLVLEE